MIKVGFVRLIRNLIFIVILLGLTQCKKESNSDTNSQLSIIGKWQLVSSTYKKYSKGVVTKIGSDDIRLVGYSIIFKNDGTAVSTDNLGGVEYLNYKLTGDSLKLTANNTSVFGITSIPIILTNTTLEWTYFSDGTINYGTQVTETLNKIK